MALFRRKSSSAVSERPGQVPVRAEALADEIRRLSDEWRVHPNRETERRLLRLRHLAGVRRLDEAAPASGYPEPDTTRLPADAGLPEFAPADLTPELVRAGILRDGCLLVRGLLPREEALALAAGIDRAFAARDA